MKIVKVQYRILAIMKMRTDISKISGRIHLVLERGYFRCSAPTNSRWDDASGYAMVMI